jgi:cation:H+ antiporter
VSVAVAVPAFVAGALVSLAVSWVLVSRLERVGERLGLSEVLLGIVAALAADAPEVTAAVAAIAGHQQRLGAGVVIGSNVFNLAALLGLGAVVAGRIRLHRNVVVLGGTVAIIVAAMCLVVVTGVLRPAAGFALVLVTVMLYAVALGANGRRLARLRLPRPWIAWIRSAVAEEESELEEAIRPRSGRWQDVAVAAVSLLVVVVASVTMERAASALGSRFAVPEIVVGGLVLAAVTSLPNAVAAVYLAGHGRGAATLSTALNSNTLNIALGLLLPATVIGLGQSTGQTALIAVWYIGLTAVTLAFAYRDRGIRRVTGILIIAAYVVFTGSLLVPPHQPDWLQIVITAGTAVAIFFGAVLAYGSRRGSRKTSPPFPPPDRQAAGPDPDQVRPAGLTADCHSPATDFQFSDGSPSWKQRNSLISGWPVSKLWFLSLAISAAIAVIDAALGHHVILIGLLIAGPCCVLLTGRWIPTGLTGLWVISLAVVLGLPDAIWGTSTHLAFLTAVAAVAAVSTIAAALIEIRTPPIQPR